MTSRTSALAVDIASDKKLQRALEAWQPGFIAWWREMGPDGFQDKDVYLRTAVGVDAQGWASYGAVKMPDYRWGIFLNPAEPGRTIGFGDHKGEPAWQDVPGGNVTNNNLVWRRIAFAPLTTTAIRAFPSMSASKSNCPASSAMRAWNTTCSSRSPSSSFRSKRSFRSMASATS